MKNQLSEALLNELTRHNKINRYIKEQADVVGADPETATEEPALPEPTDTTLGGSMPPETEAPVEPGQPIDVANDPDVEEITGDTESEVSSETSSNGGTEEVDITELVDTQKNIQSKQEEYMNSMMSKLDDLETKLSQMDSIFEKINSLEDKIEKYRPKTPEEKLHLRSLDSYPYNQKLSDFFLEKQPEMEETGKNVYTLKPEDVEDVDKTSIRKSFDAGLQN